MPPLKKKKNSMDDKEDVQTESKVTRDVSLQDSIDSRDSGPGGVESSSGNTDLMVQDTNVELDGSECEDSTKEPCVTATGLTKNSDHSDCKIHGAKQNFINNTFTNKVTWEGKSTSNHSTHDELPTLKGSASGNFVPIRKHVCPEVSWSSSRNLVNSAENSHGKACFEEEEDYGILVVSSDEEALPKWDMNDMGRSNADLSSSKSTGIAPPSTAATTGDSKGLQNLSKYFKMNTDSVKREIPESDRHFIERSKTEPSADSENRRQTEETNLALQGRSAAIKLNSSETSSAMMIQDDVNKRQISGKEEKSTDIKLAASYVVKIMSKYHQDDRIANKVILKASKRHATSRKRSFVLFSEP